MWILGLKRVNGKLAFFFKKEAWLSGQCIRLPMLRSWVQEWSHSDHCSDLFLGCPEILFLVMFVEDRNIDEKFFNTLIQ